jgi:hypothetical protein
MNMQVQGRIHTAFPAAQVTAKFRKREFVLELDGGSRFPQLVLFQLTGDRCEALDDFKVDDVVAVEFSLRGREWTSPKGETRYFNSLEVWSIGRADEASPSAREGGRGAGASQGSAGGMSAGGRAGSGSSGRGAAGGGASGGRSPRLDDDPPPHTDDDQIPF